MAAFPAGIGYNRKTTGTVRQVLFCNCRFSGRQHTPVIQFKQAAVVVYADLGVSALPTHPPFARKEFDRWLAQAKHTLGSPWIGITFLHAIRTPTQRAHPLSFTTRKPRKRHWQLRNGLLPRLSGGLSSTSTARMVASSRAQTGAVPFVGAASAH